MGYYEQLKPVIEKIAAGLGCAVTYDNRNTAPFYEEIGLGGAYVPGGISEYVAVDIAILGPDADGSEQKVTIFAKDATTSKFPEC